MTETRFGPWLLRLDPARTADGISHIGSLDSGCCQACATLLLAIERDALPGGLVALLSAAGADPKKPQEVWGAPDAGFLNAWWVVAGQIEAGPTTAEAAEQSGMEVTGHRWWVTAELAMDPPPGFAGVPLLQVELRSTAKDLQSLELDAWP